MPPSKNKNLNLKVDDGATARAKLQEAAKITREMQEEDRSSGAPELGAPGASMTIKRLGRVTAEGRRGSKTVRRMVLYVSPETAEIVARKARRAGKTMSDWADIKLSSEDAEEDELEVSA